MEPKIYLFNDRLVQLDEHVHSHEKILRVKFSKSTDCACAIIRIIDTFNDEMFAADAKNSNHTTSLYNRSNHDKNPFDGDSGQKLLETLLDIGVRVIIYLDNHWLYEFIKSEDENSYEITATIEEFQPSLDDLDDQVLGDVVKQKSMEYENPILDFVNH
jgi:hypothetical protein